MHNSALANAYMFFETYPPSPVDTIVDVGSLDINGSIKQVVPLGCNYIGVDMESGNNVDIVLTDPYVLPFANESVDYVVASSCFEHADFFWILFLEVLRVLRPAGLFYINVPSNGPFHQHPVDSWRFYPDAAKSLVNWAKRNGYNPAVLESYTSEQLDGDWWNDYVAVFVRDQAHVTKYPNRILNRFASYYNGQINLENRTNQIIMPQDQWSRWGKRPF